MALHLLLKASGKNNEARFKLQDQLLKVFCCLKLHGSPIPYSHPLRGAVMEHQYPQPLNESQNPPLQGLLLFSQILYPVRNFQQAAILPLLPCNAYWNSVSSKKEDNESLYRTHMSRF